MNLVCVVENEPSETSDILSEYFSRRFLPYEIKKYADVNTFKDDYIDGYINPTILLIEFLTKCNNELTVCKEIRNKGYIGNIIISSYSYECPLEAFKIDARGYVIRPYNYCDVFEILDRIARYSYIKTFAFKFQHTIYTIPISEILYIESNNTKCIIHLKNKKDHVTYVTLNQIEESIDDSHFLRCHQSYLINMAYVSTVSDSFILLNGDCVPIRQNRIKYTKSLYIDYLIRGGAYVNQMSRVRS